MLSISAPKTLNDIIDRATIDNIISCYAGGIDRGQWELFRSLFTPELDLHFPEWIGVPRGRQTVDTWVKLVRIVASGFDGVQHIITNRLIQIDGDSANVYAHLVAIHSYQTEAAAGIPVLGGLYTFNLVRQGDEWKISAVNFNVQWDHGDRELFKLAYVRGEGLEASR